MRLKDLVFGICKILKLNIYKRGMRAYTQAKTILIWFYIQVLKGLPY